MAETDLARRLKARIAREGPLSFHDFMQAALFEPGLGYYARGPRIGGEGADFSTSVSFAAFRQAIARLVVESERALGAPMRVVELGAGTGVLARDVLARWSGEYVTVDASPELRKRQEAAGARAVASLAELVPAPSLVLGNEVLDALPVRRVVGGPDGALLEIAVDVGRDGAFRERLVRLRDAHVEARLRREGVWPSRGQVFDVAPGLEAFVRDASRLAAPGFLVLIDYGDPASVLYRADRINGTLACYQAHAAQHDPYDDVGLRDLTADVDLTAVEHAAREAGMEPLGLASQQDFLEALGIHDLGLPDEAAMVAGAARLGSAFHVFAARRGTGARVPAF